MATKVHMEALSPTMEEGEVVNWLKSEGDEVTNGDVLAEIETDKATMELVARGEGVLRKILLGEGGTAEVGKIIAIIAAEDEEIDALIAEAGGDGGAASEEEPEEAEAAESEKAEAEEEEEEKEKEGKKGKEKEEKEEAAEEKEKTEEKEKAEEKKAQEKEKEEAEAAEEKGATRTSRKGGRIKASPLARRLAEEGDLDLAEVDGSGPGGRIVKRDVESALEKREEAPVAATGTGPAPALEDLPEDDFEDVPVSQMRKAIARRLTESIGPVPTFYLTTEVDMGNAMEARARINEILEPEGRKVSLNDLIIRATAAALRKHPECNAAWQGDFIRRYTRVHIGVAVAVDEGLITPVIRDADRKGVDRIGQEVREMAGRAREKKLKPEEYTGATFSISNLGMFGIQDFTAVINPPEAGILAVGAVEEIPVVEAGDVVVRKRMKMTMSCDHRVIDGAMGAQFLQTLKSMLEEPGVMVI